MVTTTTNLTTRRYVGRQGQDIDIIGIHTMEAPEGGQTAENVANYFKTVNASSHWCIDNNSRVRVVRDEDTAWTLPGANNRSLNIEFAGYARQTAADWADAYSIDMLEIGALSAAEWCIKFGIPVRKLTDSQIASGEKGFAGHVDVNRVYKKSSHWDPGPAFPWDYFLARVNAHIAALKGSPTDIYHPKPNTSWDNGGYSQSHIKIVQTMLNQLGYGLAVDGIRGPLTIAAVKDFQSKNGLEVDGLPGPLTTAKLRERTAQPPAGTRPDCTALQRAVRTSADNAWGALTDKHCDALREASMYHGHDFPYGVKFAQMVVGTTQDGSWGPKSVAAHDATVAAVQRALQTMGFDPNGIDGIWGPGSEAAYLAARRACRI